MDLKAKYLLETCSDPIGFLNQLRQTTAPIGGGTVYSEDGELVEYDVAVEAIKKATDAFIEKAEEFIYSALNDGIMGTANIEDFMKLFKKYMEGG